MTTVSSSEDGDRRGARAASALRGGTGPRTPPPPPPATGERLRDARPATLARHSLSARLDGEDLMDTLVDRGEA